MATAKAAAEIDIDLKLADRVSERALERGLRGAMLEGVRLTKEQLSQPGSGKIYGDHQASAPGEPPAPDSGTTRESTNGEIVNRGGNIKAIVSVDGENAEALEIGTENIEPRPFLSTVITKGAKRLFQAFVISARGR